MYIGPRYGDLVDVLADAELSYRVQATRSYSHSRDANVQSKTTDATSQVFMPWLSIFFVVLETFCSILRRLYK